jgi:DNA-binding IclR family transcriptional regulator
LCAFTNERNAYTLTQLTEAVRLPRPRHQARSTLIKYGFMKFDHASMQYSLGIKLFEWGA